MQRFFWLGVVAPGGTPPAIVNKLNAALRETLAFPETRQRLANFDADVAIGSPEEFRKMLADELAFWERFRVYLRRFPPPAADQAFVDVATSVGLLDDRSPFAEPNPELAAVLTQGATNARALLESLASGQGTQPGTWTSALHMFDYNLDRCGLGTIDTPDWKIGDRKQFIEAVRQALYASKICSYAQGFVQLQAAAEEYRRRILGRFEQTLRARPLANAAAQPTNRTDAAVSE